MLKKKINFSFEQIKKHKPEFYLYILFNVSYIFVHVFVSRHKKLKLTHCWFEYDNFINKKLYYTLLAGAFCHTSWWHLFGNISFFSFFGFSALCYLGIPLFLFVFFGSHLLTELFDFFFTSSGGVGASLTHAGIFGAYAPDWMIYIYGGINLLLERLRLTYPENPYINKVLWAHHLPPLVFGFIVKKIARIKKKKQITLIEIIFGISSGLISLSFLILAVIK